MEVMRVLGMITGFFSGVETGIHSTFTIFTFFTLNHLLIFIVETWNHPHLHICAVKDC